MNNEAKVYFDEAEYVTTNKKKQIKVSEKMIKGKLLFVCTSAAGSS